MSQIAKVRLFHNADKSKLVAEDSDDAAFLYANTGDEIPDSACELYGLVDGNLKGAGKVSAAEKKAAEKKAAEKAAAEAAEKEAEQKAAAEAANKATAPGENKGK